MKPLSLKLKNFKGIRAGMGLDEVEIDLSEIKGIAVFSAPNGSGKTTILDNLHPYRLMPYRSSGYRPSSFSFYEHVYETAMKEFVFEIEGICYRSVVLVDTYKKKQEAYLFKKNGEGWLPLTDGKIDSYDKKIEEICGSPGLFFVSIFRSQNARSLSDYTKGDIKSLFVELLGIESLKTIGEKAGEKKKESQVSLQVLRNEENRLKEIIALENSIFEENLSLENKTLIEKEKIASQEKGLEELKNSLKETEIALAKQEEQKSLLKRLQGELEKEKIEFSRFQENFQKKVAGYKKKLESYPERERKLKELIQTLPELKKKELQKNETLKEIEEVKANLDKRTKLEFILKDYEKQLQKLAMQRESKKALAERELKEAEKKASLLDSVPCNPETASSCLFAKDAVEARNNLNILKEKLISVSFLSDNEVAIAKEIKKLKTILSEISETSFLREELSKKESFIAEIDSQLRLLPLAENAEEEIVRLEKEKEAVETEMADEAEQYDRAELDFKEKVISLEKEIEGISLDPSIEAKISSLKEKMTQIEEEISASRRIINSLTIMLGVSKNRLEEVEKAKSNLVETKEKITRFENEISEWALLEKAFSNDGIIALEIDDAGPQISAIANELLKVFGGRFSIRFDTQAAKADGRSLKETFDITVFDAETNEAKSIKRLSGGEKTWVEDAITKAICIYNKNTSGKEFKTIFTDEKDGALDAEKKREFFLMKRKVLEIGGYDAEFCITQTPELVEMADTVITLEKGSIKTN